MKRPDEYKNGVVAIAELTDCVRNGVCSLLEGEESGLKEAAECQRINRCVQIASRAKAPSPPAAAPAAVLIIVPNCVLGLHSDHITRFAVKREIVPVI